MFNSWLINKLKATCDSSLSKITRGHSVALYFPNAIYSPFSLNKFLSSMAWLEDRLYPRLDTHKYLCQCHQGELAKDFRATHCHVPSVNITREEDPTLAAQVQGPTAVT